MDDKEKNYLFEDFMSLLIYEIVKNFSLILFKDSV